MNRDKRAILYKKIKQYASSPKKNLRFNLNPVLDREESLKDDLIFLKHIRFDPIVPQESEVCYEQYHQDDVLVTTLNEGDIWDLVFSNEWSQYSSLRICEGQLLETILQSLFSFVEKKILKTYKMSKFDVLERYTHSKSKLKKTDETSNTRSLPQLTATKVPVKLKFTYYSKTANISDDGTIPKYNTTSASGQIRDNLLSEHASDISGDVHNYENITPSVKSTKSLSIVSECGDSSSSVIIPWVNEIATNTSPENMNDLVCDEMSTTGTKDCVNSQLSSPEDILKNVSTSEFSINEDVSIGKDISSGVREKLSSTDSIIELKLNSDKSQISFPGRGKSATPTFSKHGAYNAFTSSLPNTIKQRSLQDGSGSIFSNAHAERNVISAPVYEYIQFETDYDPIKHSNNTIDIVSSNTLEDETKKENTLGDETKTESRIFLRDPEEHLIGPDDSDFYDINNDISESLWNQSPVAGSCIDFTSKIKLHQTVSKQVSFKSASTGSLTSIAEPDLDKQQKTNSSKGILKVKNGKINSKIKQQRNIYNSAFHRSKNSKTVYLKIIENSRKQKRLNQTSKLETPSHNITGDEVDEIIQPNTHFEDIVSNYSIKMLKMDRKIGKYAENTRNECDVINMIENFLEEKYSSKFTSIPENIKKKSFKLNPTQFTPPTSSTRKSSFNEESLRNVSANNFQQRIPNDFKEHLLKACESFIIRKEQITLSNSWQTLTCVTINRKLPKLFEQ